MRKLAWAICRHKSLLLEDKMHRLLMVYHKYDNSTVGFGSSQ